MYDLVSLEESLNSFFNLAQATLRHTNQLTTNDLELIVGLTRESIRGRFRNPSLWRISEIKLIAEHYHLSPRICGQMYRVIPNLISYFQQLSIEDRKQAEQLCQVKMTLLISRINYDLSISDLKKIHKGLGQLKDGFVSSYDKNRLV